jgi:hypothetical protein
MKQETDTTMLMESGDETYPGKPEMEVMKNSVII